MSEISEKKFEEIIGAIKSRIMRHSFDHLSEVYDARSAMVIAKNGLLKSMPKSQYPEEVTQIIEDPTHADRWPGTNGPFIVFRDNSNSRVLIELAKVLLNPDLRLRRAALAELDRQIIQHSERHDLFLSPQTQQRINELREAVSSEDIRESLTASLEVNDLLENDYFYQLAGVRQCAQLRFDSEFPTLLSLVLAPNEQAIRFLVQLPVWSPQRQQADIQQIRNRIIDESPSLGELLSAYFRLFGHLPLAGENSVAGVVASWIERHDLPENPWDIIWDWANENSSPLACYHACQLLCHNPRFVPEEHRHALLRTIASIVLGAESNQRWKLRCDLARHYCRHLETLDSGADGERVAAFAWWLAEYLCDMLDNFSKETKEACNSTLTEAFKISGDVWSVARPPVSISSLRYATLFSRSIWATAILCELSESELLEWLDPNCKELDVLEKTLCKLPYNSVGAGEKSRISYAFESSTTILTQRIRELRSESDHVLKQTQSALMAARSEQGLERLTKELSTADEILARVVAHELRLQSMCGELPYGVLFELFSDSSWRNDVFGNGDEAFVELLCSAAIEISLHDSANDWRTYLPHFFAMTCDEAQEEDKRRHLFAYTVVASLATGSVSAVERLLKGDNLRAYEALIADWRQRIEKLTPVAPAWISARLRGMKAVLYIG